MSAIEVNWDPTVRQLRQFAWISLAGLPLVGWFFTGRPGPASWEPFHTTWIGGLAAAGAALVLLSKLQPRLIMPVFIGLSIVTFPIGLVLSEVILLAIYGMVFVPVALVFRLLRRDVLQRKTDRGANSYWTPKAPAKDVASYFRQS